MTPNELIDISVDIGAALLENGAEIYRVEESIARICYAYGAAETQCCASRADCDYRFICAGRCPPGPRVQRIYQRGTNLGRLDQLNTLCREITQHQRRRKSEAPRILTTNRSDGISCVLRPAALDFLLPAVSRFYLRSHLQFFHMYCPVGHHDIFTGTSCQSAVTNVIGWHLGRAIRWYAEAAYH